MTEAQKYLENHELYSDIMHWKHISIIMKDYKDSLLEEIEKYLPSDDDLYESYLKGRELNGTQVRNEIRAAINKLKKG